MWRRSTRDAVAALCAVLLLIMTSQATVSTPARIAPDTASSVRALASPAHSGLYSIFNFKNADSPVVDPRTGFVYVADEGYGRTTIYDPARSAVVGYINGIAGVMAFDAASGELAVIQGDGVVFADATTGAIVATVSGLAPLGWRHPALALDPVDGLLFVAYNFQGNGAIWAGCTIQVVSLRLHAVIASINDLWWTTGMTYDSLDGRIYAANIIGGLTAIDPKTLAVVGTVSGLDGPNQIAVNPVDGNLYIPSWNGRVLPGTSGWTFTASVAIVDPVVLRFVGNLTGFHAGYDGPQYIVYNAADASLYIANGTSVIALNATSHAVRYAVSGLEYPGPLAVDPLNGHVYAAEGDGLVDLDPVARTGTILGHEYFGPYGVAYDSARNRIYASNRGGSTVVVIDAATDRIVGSLGGFYSPDSVTYDPLADELFVGNELNYTVSIVDLKTNTTVGLIADVQPWSVRFDDLSGRLFIGTDSGMLVVSGRTNTIIANVTTYGSLAPMAVDSVGGRLFALTRSSALTPVPESLLAIRTQDLSLAWEANVTDLGITALAFDPANGDLYAGRWTYGAAVLDGANGNVLAKIPGPWEPQAVLFNPANGYVYISDQGPYGNLWVIDPATNQVVHSEELPDQGNRMAYDPVNQEIYIAVGMLGFRGGHVVAVPSLAYPPPPLGVEVWAWALAVVGAVAISAVLVVRDRRRRRAPREAREPETPPEPPPAEETPPAAKEWPPLSPREKLALSAMALALLLTVSVLFGPWFVLTRTVTGAAAATDVRGYGVTGWTATDTVPGLTATVAGNYLASPSLAALFLAMGVVTAMAAIAILVEIVLVLLPRHGPRSRRLSVLVGLVAAGLALAAPIAFEILFPGAAQADGLLASGSHISQASWGPGWAWAVLLIAGGLLLVGSGTLAEDRRAGGSPRFPA